MNEYLESLPDVGNHPDSGQGWENGSRLEWVKRIVKDAPVILGALPYRVSLRWLFYRLFQEGYFPSNEGKESGAYKADCYKKLKAIKSRAVYSENEWRWPPDICTDEGRNRVAQSGFWDGEERAATLVKQANCRIDINGASDFYVMLCFEAQAMAQQFKHYTREYPVDLWPFAGDPSHDFKNDLARHCAVLTHEMMDRGFQKPILLYYFGDLDPKGMVIPESAIYRVREWAFDKSVYVEIIAKRVGLLDHHPELFGMESAESFDQSSGQWITKFQWEALADDQAGDLIIEALESVFDLDEIKKINHEAASYTKRAKAALKDKLLNDENPYRKY